MGWRTSVRKVMAAALTVAAMTGLAGCAAHEERTKTTKPLITILLHAGSGTDGTSTTASGAGSTSSLAATRSAWKALASAYTRQKGVRVTVRVTSASQYTSALRSAMAAPTPPTLFMVDGPAGAQRWHDYLADLGRSAAYSHLENRQLALRDGGTVVAVPAGDESYGIVYRTDILKKYFALAKKAASDTSADKTAGKTTDKTVTSLSQITSPSALARLVAGLQSRRTELGLDRALASGALSAGTGGTDGGWGADQIADLALGCTLGTTNSIGIVRSLDGLDPHQQESPNSSQGSQGSQDGGQGGSQNGSQGGSQGDGTTGGRSAQKKVGAQQVKAVRCVNGVRTLVDTATGAGADAGESSSQALQDFVSGKAALLPAGTGVWAALSKAGLKSSQVGFLPARFSQSSLTKTDIADLTGQTDQTGQDTADQDQAGKDTTGSSLSAAALPQAATAAATTQSGFISGSDQYWAVNSQASHVDQTATAAFLDWAVTSRTGRDAARRLGLWLPYQQKAEKAGTGEKSSGSTGSSGGVAAANPLRTAVLAHWRAAAKGRVDEPDLMEKHRLAPTDAWRTSTASALRAYAASPSDTTWGAVREAFLTGWRTQYLTTE